MCFWEEEAQGSKEGSRHHPPTYFLGSLATLSHLSYNPKSKLGMWLGVEAKPQCCPSQPSKTGTYPL